MIGIQRREYRGMAINIEVRIARSLQESTSRHIDGIYSICVTNIDFVGRDSNEGSVPGMRGVDDGRLVTNVRMVV